ncbi:PduO protein [Zoogloea ramigera]|uniref:PduO protein n=2 Tax=Zoogloea ramigera TaxID=350 RepID=A0A4Y4CQ08_ZOORA|nr:PduO protein [Zoogloea ramigera]
MREPNMSQKPVSTVAVPQSVVSAEAVSVALEAAVAKAAELGVKINVAVADSGGNLSGFLRMPGAFVQSIDIAIDKAYTAAGFGFSTKDWMKLIGHDDGMKFGFSARPRLVVFGGGLPLRVNGELIGGIGVSGASEEQDEICARAALDAIGAE